MNLRKLLAVAMLILSPLVMMAVSLMIPNLPLVLGLILLQNPETRQLGIAWILFFLFTPVAFLPWLIAPLF